MKRKTVSDVPKYQTKPEQTAQQLANVLSDYQSNLGSVYERLAQCHQDGAIDEALRQQIGQDAASLLGVNVKALRIITIICASASAASVVSFAGLLGFVGLVVPHIARAFVGERVAFLLPTSAILGASVTVLADFIGRIIISPSEIPVGIMMAVIGAPFFIFLLFNKRGEY